MTLLSDSAKVWDVRFDLPHRYSVPQYDGTSKEYASRIHVHACVSAETIARAIEMVLAEWPAATIWSVNNHGKQCHVLVDEPLRVRE